MPGTVPGSSVREFYNDANILITGATGFLGKALLDKFLRVCTNVNHIYLLIRFKKGKDPQMRLKDLLKDPLFDMLRRERPGFEKKITCISGDIGAANLGMSDDDYDFLRKELTHVIHSAATVRFNERLKNAVGTNVRGTVEVIKLCNLCDRLKIFVYVSTAYSHCHRRLIGEEYYEPPVNGQQAVYISESFSDEKLEAITPELIKPWPNTYSYTKAIAEATVRELSNRVPTAVFRPGIVMGTYREPVEGWIDNVYGPTGIIVAVGAGLMRVIYADDNSTANVVPVDLTVNALIACAWEVGTSFNNNSITENALDDPKYPKLGTDGPKIYNFVIHEDNEITWGEFLNLNLKHGLKVPTIRSIWYYSLTFTKCKYMYYTLILFLHYLPAIIIDGAFLLLRKKPLLWQGYQKIHKFSKVMQVFSNANWKFTDDNVRTLWSRMSDADKEIFPFNMSDLAWDEYFAKVVIGVRRYIFCEKDQTLPAAKRKMFFFWIGHRLVQTCFVAFCFWVLSKIFFML